MNGLMVGSIACPGFHVLTQLKMAELTQELLKNSSLPVHIPGRLESALQSIQLQTVQFS